MCSISMRNIKKQMSFAARTVTHQWKELHTHDGKWIFNSSIAEQTNAWVGGYHAMLHEMLPQNYNFFLDEMIMRWNELVVDKLQKRNLRPITKLRMGI